MQVNSPQNWRKKTIKPISNSASVKRRVKSNETSQVAKERRKKAVEEKKKENAILRNKNRKATKLQLKKPKVGNTFRIRKASIGKHGGKRVGGTGSDKIKKMAMKVGKVVLILAIIGVVFGFFVFWYYSGQVPTREEFLTAAEGRSTKIYDRTGEHVLYNVFSDQKKTWIPLDQIPDHVKWALISIEDDQFYAHKGFDIPALIKVGLHEVFGIGPQRGGSTITQQLVKNAVLTPERSYKRKIRELVIAYHLEKKMSKDEILELYFNVVSYGSTAYGIEAGAETYFGKKASELDLAEGAVLAAMLKATTYYSPYGSHVDELMARQQVVLRKMHSLGYISEEELDSALNKDLEFKRMTEDMTAPHFVLYIKEILAEKYGEAMIEKGGLKVITTLDYDKQLIAEESIRAGVERNEEKYSAHNASLVSIDANTGEVLAMVGSRDYFDEEHDGAVNVSMRPRQPGSSFKPIVFAASFIKGLSPETIMYDVVTKFKTETGEDYEPHNYDDSENGPVSIRRALQGSLNIPAVKAIYLTGVSEVIDLAEKMGYTTFADRSRFGLSLVLGGGEVKLVDHVKAFSVFASEGEVRDLQYVLRVEDGNGKTLEEFNPERVRTKRVMDKEVARRINDVLSDDEARSYVFGLGSNLTLPGRPVAAKTGTTNDYRDGWTIGYTPSIVTGVWVGNNDNVAMKGKAAGGNVAAPIWNEYMKKSLEGSEVEVFTKPKEQELPNKPMLNGKEAEEIVVQIDRVSGKLATPQTPPELIEEKIFQEMHSILHYVNKDNILGPIPDKPEKDNHYDLFEEAIKIWAEENEYEINNEIPTEYDDVHTEDNKPGLEIVFPGNNKFYNNPSLDVRISVNTKRSLDRVDYFIDDQIIASVKTWPYNLDDYKLLGFPNGNHKLRVIAYDDVGNSREQYRDIYFELPEEYTKDVTWQSPKEGVIYPEQFPLTVRVGVNNPSLYKKIDFYIKKDEGKSQWVGYSEPVARSANVVLTELESGNYDFYVVLTRQDGRIKQDGGIKVEIVD